MKKQKNHIGVNLKFLRERKKKTQMEVAEALGVTRAKINAFENGVNSNPTVEDLGRFTEYFKISVDSLLWLNLKGLTEVQLKNLEAGNDDYVKGTKIRVLATTIDKKNRDNIEIVPIKARAGYLTGFGNPEFVSKLPSFHLPVLSKERKYRMFQIDGDSMIPIPDKSFVLAEYVQNWYDIKNGSNCIVITQDDGIVFKTVYNQLKENKMLVLKSLNKNYKDYSVSVEKISEVWSFVSYMATEIPTEEQSIDSLVGILKNLKVGITT